MKLEPAILWKDELVKESRKLYYTDDYMYYNGCLCNNPIQPDDSDYDEGRFSYAIVDNSDNMNPKLVGFIAFTIDWYAATAYRFGLISFNKQNVCVGLAVRAIMKRLIGEYHLHRIEFRCIEGNPVKRHYDKFCDMLHGYCVYLHDVFKDRYGNYRGEYIYEFIFEEDK